MNNNFSNADADKNIFQRNNYSTIQKLIYSL